MKKLSVLFVSALVLGMTFTSCNKDDESTPSVTGKWNYSKMSINGSPDRDFNNTSGCSKNYLEFKDGAVLNDVGYYKDDSNGCHEYRTSGTWSQENSNVTTVEGNRVISYNVVSISITELKLKYTYNENGTSYIYIFTFTKG